MEAFWSICSAYQPIHSYSGENELLKRSFINFFDANFLNTLSKVKLI